MLSSEECQDKLGYPRIKEAALLNEFLGRTNKCLWRISPSCVVYGNIMKTLNCCQGDPITFPNECGLCVLQVKTFHHPLL